MMVVDAQVHIWAPNTPERPWPARHEPHKPQPITAGNLLAEMKAAGVDKCVLVPPSWEGERNDVCFAAAQKHPDKFAVMGRLDPEDPASRGMIAGWRKQPGMLGLRFTFHRPFLRPLLAEGKDEEAFKDIGNVLALAKRPNVAVKASCLPHYTTDQYPFKKLDSYIRRVYDAFGPKRVFWGSDLSRLPCTYRQSLTYLTEETPWLTAGDKEWITGRGLCEWLGWKT